MTQKIIRIGTSAAVIMPKSFMKAAGIKVGNRVSVVCDPKKRTMKVACEEKAKGRSREQEVIAKTMKIIGKYRKDFETLAKK